MYVWLLSDDVDISNGSCNAIISNVFGMKQVVAKFIPKLLIFEQKIMPIRSCIGVAKQSKKWSRIVKIYQHGWWSIG